MRTYPRSGFRSRGNIRMYPRSGFRSGGTSAKSALLENHPFLDGVSKPSLRGGTSESLEPEEHCLAPALFLCARRLRVMGRSGRAGKRQLGKAAAAIQNFWIGPMDRLSHVPVPEMQHVSILVLPTPYPASKTQWGTAVVQGACFCESAFVWFRGLTNPVAE